MIWFLFCFSQRSAVWSSVLYWIALLRHSTVYQTWLCYSVIDIMNTSQHTSRHVVFLGFIDWLWKKTIRSFFSCCNPSVAMEIWPAYITAHTSVWSRFDVMATEVKLIWSNSNNLHHIHNVEWCNMHIHTFTHIHTRHTNNGESYKMHIHKFTHIHTDWGCLGAMWHISGENVYSQWFPGYRNFVVN